MAIFVRVVLAVILGSFFLVGLGVLLLWVSVSGGWDDAFRFDRPEDGDPEVVAAEEAVRDPFVAASRTHALDVVVPALGAESAYVGNAVIRTPCTVGHHDWKRDDDFDLSCELAAIEIVTMPERSHFGTDMEALDAALATEGWASRSEWSTMERVLVERWPEEEYVEGQPVDGFPRVEYERTVDGVVQRLDVDWFQRGTGPEAITFFERWGEFRTADGVVTAQRDLVAMVPRPGYAISLTTTVVFFHE